jgi:hypothetical protein
MQVCEEDTDCLSDYLLTHSFETPEGTIRFDADGEVEKELVVRPLQER